MGLFNFKKSKSSEQLSSSETSPSTSSWDSLANAESSLNSPESSEAASDRQERKLLNYLSSESFSEEPLDASAEFSAYSKFGDLLSDNASYAYEENFLSKIRGNLEDTSKGSGWIAANIAGDPWQQQIYENICAQLEIPLPDQSSALTKNTSTIDQFFATELPSGFKLSTPVGFEQPRRNFMAAIRQHFDPATCTQYAAAMERFEQTLYGKRFEYHQAFDSIREATPDRNNWAVMLDDPHPDYFQQEVDARLSATARKSYEQSPEYEAAKSTGERLAANYLSALAQNPQHADTIRSAFESYLKSHREH